MRLKVKLSALFSIILLTACAQPMNKATTGALTGSTIGAGIGAIVGNQSGNAGPGIAIGAAAGALGGALLGNAMDAQDQQTQASRDEIARHDAQIKENQRLIDELRRRGADVTSTKRGVVINLPDVLFDYDRYSLTYDARNTVGEIAEVLRNVKNRPIAVEGHTDSKGTMIYNQRLSERRAQTVADSLAGNGVSEAQIKVRGYGEGAAIATNNSDVGRARNRRVEVIVEN